MSESLPPPRAPSYSLTALAVCAACAAIVYVAINAVKVLQRLDESIAIAGGAEYLLEPSVDLLVDRLNESGYDRQPIDPDDPLLKRRTIVISEGVHERLATRVIERLLYLDAIEPGEPIELRITTSGGWVDSAFAIVDTMRSIESPVNAVAVGGCYSAGTVILAGATGERTATPNALLSVHVNDYYRGGEAFEADTHELVRFRDLYLDHTSVPGEWFEAEGEEHYYFDAQQALKFGLIDRLAKPAWESPAEEKRRKRPAA
ncbi:ATP-dependent Clp protease proteolytic subunit 1 [Planctomycetes bacterium MalM25]|nr:ATP-dependent Clp protease proteolytic subunit 1 [Planctomycetes bacterium MalM25]